MQRLWRESELGRKPSTKTVWSIFLPLQRSNGDRHIESCRSLLIVVWKERGIWYRFLAILPCVAGLLNSSPLPVWND